MTTPTDTMPDEWEEFTVRVKKDPSWPYHGAKLGCALAKYMHVRTPEDHALIEAAARDYLVLRGQLKRILK